VTPLQFRLVTTYRGGREIVATTLPDGLPPGSVLRLVELRQRGRTVRTLVVDPPAAEGGASSAGDRPASEDRR
jgi:hypothetical protein